MTLLRTCILLLFCASAFAQGARTPKIGIIVGSEIMAPIGHAFIKGMAEFGYVEGRNVQYIQRFGDGTNETAAKMAREMIEANVDVIWAPGTQASTAARKLTSTLPI